MSFGYPDSVRASLGILGVTKVDTAARIIAAYRLQCACDEESRPKYLSALCEIAEPDVRGKEDLQLQVSLERSMGHFTLRTSLFAVSRISTVRTGYSSALNGHRMSPRLTCRGARIRI